jgi:hypothetical protein
MVSIVIRMNHLSFSESDPKLCQNVTPNSHSTLMRYKRKGVTVGGKGHLVILFSTA